MEKELSEKTILERVEMYCKFNCSLTHEERGEIQIPISDGKEYGTLYLDMNLDDPCKQCQVKKAIRDAFSYKE